MTPEFVAVPDTQQLLQNALQQSWKRDRFVRLWRMGFRWCEWLLVRCGSLVAASIVIVASSPVSFTSTEELVRPVDLAAPIDSLPLKPTSVLSFPPL